MWLLVLRYSLDIFVLAPAITWGCVIVSTAISLALERFLYLPLRSHG